MARRTITPFLLGLLLSFGLSVNVFAREEMGCDGRYLTLINPVRGRNLWLDNSLKPLENQYKAIAARNFSATWLLQYDALTDKEIISFVKEHFSSNQEVGLFLEISPDLAGSARVIYPPLTPWFKPQAVFLSGYSQSERRKLIDTVFKKFSEVFDKYPVSVGAWWIDSYSLEYMEKKYDIKTVLIVADQQTTDNYGVWGQWWGIPYYPSFANVLVPAQNIKDKLDVVVLQWAQRDITKADGSGASFSNNSLQANDYTERGLNTSYFMQLANRYLDCQLPIGQITVGLETGIESIKAFQEYQNQVDALAKEKNIQDLTMAEFSDRYRHLYPSNPEKIVLKDDTSEWVLTLQGRENRYLKEKIIYQNNLAFTDYFVPDKFDFLDRKLPISGTRDSLLIPYLVLLAFLLGLMLYRKERLVRYYWCITFFILVSFLTTFLIYRKFGRTVYFGPVLENVTLIQFSLALLSYVLFIPALKYLSRGVKNLSLLAMCLPLSYGLDFIISVLRYTQLHGEYYLGFAWDSLRFIGLKISPKSLAVVNQDFPSLIAGSLLKFDFSSIWENQIVSFVVYPLAHIIVGMVIYFFLSKLSKKLRWLALIILFIFLCFYIYHTVTLNPRVVY